MAVRFDLKKTYNFSTLAPKILGQTFKGMKVIALLVASEAIKNADVTTTHAVVRTVISAVPESVNDCHFIVFELNNGEHKILAEEYIDPYSIVEVTKTHLRVNILDVTSADITLIPAYLKELGYTNVIVEPYDE